MHNPFLVGETIYLRAIEESDLTERYQQWFNDAEVCRFNDHHRFPNYRENMVEYYTTVIKPHEHLILAIIDKATDQHIGNVALQSLDKINRSAELAIIVGEKEFWGRGVGTEACRLIIGHGFRSLNLHRIYCGTSALNTGMQKLAESLGFIKEGAFREALFKDGSYHDLIQYGLLESEFRA